MADIFISYSNEDRERITPIVKALENEGWSTFWDCTSIPVGKTWRQCITEGLDDTSCVLVLWSKKSINSEWVIEEADHGKTNKMLVPARIDNVRPPMGFGQIQAANLTIWTDDINDPEFKRLVEAIESILDPSPKNVKKKGEEAETEYNREQKEERKRVEEKPRKGKKSHIKEEAASVAGTIWVGKKTDGDSIKVWFKENGRLYHKSSGSTVHNTLKKAKINKDGSWRQEGNAIYFEMNKKYVECQGRIAGTHKEGNARNIEGKKWTWILNKK